MAAKSDSEECGNINRKSVAAADCSQSNPDATTKNTNTISDPNKLTNSELNTANIEEKRLTCLYGENHVGVAAVLVSTQECQLFENEIIESALFLTKKSDISNFTVLRKLFHLQPLYTKYTFKTLEMPTP